MSTNRVENNFGDWARRIIARGEAYRAKVKSGEIKPEEIKAGQGTGESQEPKKLKIGDLGLPFISAHIS